jgi:hypothetical protein
MEEKLKLEVVDLINKAQEQIAAGDIEGANATLGLIKDKIKTPLPGTGSNGRDNG